MLGTLKRRNFGVHEETVPMETALVASTRTVRSTIEMKKDLHPDYKTVTVTLADGTTMVTKSTLGVDQYKSDVDRTNHPFYTGRRQYVDTAGRVEKFNRRYAKHGKKADETEKTDSDE